MTDNNSIKAGQIRLSEVLAKVRREYSAKISEALRAEVAVVASLSYADMKCCLALILEGRSGVGKSQLIEMLYPITETQKYLKREDRFTAASFVSNASNVKKEALTDIDLLPKLKNKVMLTKELGSIFGSDDKALRENFGILTTVLDGKGYKTATGTHGDRGYEGDYRFNWIGATTPVPSRIHDIMAGFGHRFLFYECNSPDPTFEEFYVKQKNSNSYSMQAECNEQVNSFIAQHFQRHPVNSVSDSDIEMSKHFAEEIWNCALLMTHGRRAISCDDKKAQVDLDTEAKYYAGPAEAPYRPFEMFRCICIGSALTADRRQFTVDDLAIVRHIAISSIPVKRRRILKCLIQSGGTLSSWDVVKQLGCSKPTALLWMRELAATEICEFKENEQGSNDPSSINIKEEFRFLIETSERLVGSNTLPTPGPKPLSPERLIQVVA